MGNNAMENNVTTNEAEVMSIEPIRFERSSIPWTVTTLVNHMDKGNAIYSNAVQRTLVWDTARKSALIMSLIENVAIPPFYCNKYENEETGKPIYDFLDGKQRSHALHDFVRGEFALTGVDLLECEGNETVDLNGKYFDDLPKNLQDFITGYSLNITCFDDCDDEECKEIFDRLNNGMSLTAIEKSRVRAVDLEGIEELCKHSLFNHLTEKERRKYEDEDRVVKSIMVVTDDEPVINAADARKFMETTSITDDIKKKMTDIYDIIDDAYDNLEAIVSIMLENEDLPKKQHTIARKALKKATSKLHFITLAQVVGSDIDSFIEAGGDKIAHFLLDFFFVDRKGAVSQRYTDVSQSGTGKRRYVKIRFEEMSKYWNEYEYDPELENEEEEDKAVEEVVETEAAESEEVETETVETEPEVIEGEVETDTVEDETETESEDVDIAELIGDKEFEDGETVEKYTALEEINNLPDAVNE